jgi:hypothetical protein
MPCTLKKKRCSTEPPEKVPEILKASNCVKSLKKRNIKIDRTFNGSAFYPTAEPSLAEPFFKFRTAEKGFVGKYETFGGSD